MLSLFVNFVFSSFSGVPGINQFDGGDDITDDDIDDGGPDPEDFPPVVMCDVCSIPQFDGAGDLIELDAPAKTTPTPTPPVPGGASVLTGIGCLYFMF